MTAQVVKLRNGTVYPYKVVLGRNETVALVRSEEEAELIAAALRLANGKDAG